MDEAEHLWRNARVRRAMRVRRISGGITLLTAAGAVIAVFAIVWALPERWTTLALIAMLGGFAWLGSRNAIGRIAERIEDWLSSLP